MTVNLSFESFTLDHSTFALLLQATLFLSKKHGISIYILSHLADLDSSMSFHKYYIVSTHFFGQRFEDNHGTPAGETRSLYTPASFMPLLDPFVWGILLLLLLVVVVVVVVISSSLLSLLLLL